MKKIILCFLIFCTNSQIILAKSYKVNSENEFKVILSKLAAGDEVIITNGDYSNWAIEIPTKATDSKPLIIRAEKNGKVVFNGATDQTIFKITGTHVILKGILFRNCLLIKSTNKTGLLIDLNNSAYCTITNCTFEKNTSKVQYSPLVMISGNGRYNVIENCLFNENIDNQDVQVKITKDTCPLFSWVRKNTFSNKNKVSWENGNGGECIQIGQDPVLLGNKEPYCMISENNFKNCNGENEIISNKSSKNNYLNNYFKNNDGELVMRGGHDCVIKGNTFDGGTGGIRVNGTGHIIFTNKINNIKTAIRLMYGMAKGKQEIGFYIAASNCIISNNQISNATTGILVGDSKDSDWTGKFDTTRYPSPVMQSIAPFDNKITGNTFSNTKTEQVNQ